MATVTTDVDFSESRGTEVNVIAWVFTSIAIATVFLKLFARAQTAKRLGWDDFFIFASLAFSIIAAAFVSYSVTLGLGRHTAAVTAEYGAERLVLTAKWQILGIGTAKSTHDRALLVRLSDVRPLFQASLAAAVGGLVGATSMPFDLDMVGRLLSGVAGLPWTWFALIIPALVLLYRWLYHTDVPKIKGLFEIPRPLPIVGHLFQLGDDHATACERLWRRYGHSTFQIRLGNTRAVVFSSFEDARRILVANQSSVIDRPTLYTFHGVISSTKGFTIGSSPWDESTKNRRTAAGAVLSRPAIRRYSEMFDLETFSLIADTFKDSQHGTRDISIRPYIQRLALNTTLTLCYGIRMDNVYDHLLREILEVGSAISLLRSASENFQDYVPVLRYLPNNTKIQKAKELRQRRDKYLEFLLDKVREKIRDGTDKPCVSAAIIRGEDTKLSDVELSSICLSLVSGGFETIPATLTSCIGSLSTKEGQVFQERAYEDIKRHYTGSTEEAWMESFAEEKVPYVNALVKEAGRYYTASAMNLPRKTTSPVDWDGATIPAKTMILVNLQAANHDIGHFGSDAGKFNPERWLEPRESSAAPRERPIQGLAHMSFGAGARACPGHHVAARVIYTALVRLLTSYRIIASEDEPPNTDYADYNQIKSALVAIPRDFKVKLVPRNSLELEECLRTSKQRTEQYYVE